jgi:hypothetical protein
MNPKLLTGISADKLEAVKAVLFCIGSGFSDLSFFKEDVFRECLTLLSSNGSLAPMYDGDKKYMLRYPLESNEVEVKPEMVDNLRKEFSKDLTGKPGLIATKDSVQICLSAFIQKHGQITEEAVIKAAKRYIQHCKQEGIIIRHCNRFVMTEQDSILQTWLEETKSDNPESKDWRIKIG